MRVGLLLAGGPPGAALAEEVPALVERHLEVGQALAVLGPEVLAVVLLVERVLLA